jgi:hypothetical protein
MNVVGPDNGGVMKKRRFQLRLRGLMIAVAIVAGIMLLVTPASERSAPIVMVFGHCVIGRDGSVRVQDGSVRVREDGEQAEIRAGGVLVKSDGTIEVFGAGTLLQRVR